MSAWASTAARLSPRLVVVWLAIAALAVMDLRADIAAGIRWADPSHVKLGIEFPGEGYHAQWELFRCDCGDLLVRSELNVPGEVEAGESLLVGGRAVLSRGFAGDAELGSSLDAPALMMQLALRLLERAEPGGPARITQVADIDVTEQDSPIMLQSYSAIGGFQAPWTVQGRISPEGQTRRRFDLTFEFTAGAGSAAQQGSMRLKGVADFAELEFPLAGVTPLAGWTLTWRDERDAEAAAASELQTLGELRTLLRETTP